MRAVDVHALLQMATVATVLVASARVAFRGRPASRRQLSIAAAVVLVLLPVGVTFAPRVLWPIGIDGHEALRVWLGLPTPAWVLAIWLGGAAAGSALALAAFVRTHRVVDALPRHRSRRVLDVVNDGRRRLGIQAPVDVRVSTRGGPCSWPGRRATIVLPREATRWPRWIVDAAVAHELVHLARRDAWFALLVRCARMLWWPIPGARSLERAFTRSTEESCDDRAAAALGDPGAYARALAWIAARSVQDRSPMFVAPALTTHEFPRRIERFLRPRDVLPEPIRVAVLLGVSFVTAFALTAFEPIEPASTRIDAIPLRPLDPLDDAVLRTRRTALAAAGTLDVVPDADTPAPVYPGAALNSGIEGRVDLRYRVDRNGRVAGIEIVHSDHVLLTRAAERALRLTRFKIITDGGGVDAAAIRTERFDFALPNR